MKKPFYFLLLISLLSCGKDDVIPASPKQGLLEEYFNDNPKIIIQKTTDSNVVYEGGVATYRGYVFSPIVDINLTAIGGRIAEKGTYKYEVFKLNEYWVSINDTLLMESINVQDINNFQYINLKKEIHLSPKERYLIRYFNENHNSVYDAGLGTSHSDAVNYIQFPLTLKEIEIETLIIPTTLSIIMNIG